MAALTAIFLQILSNLANDYGDSVHGADSIHREGPGRAVQTGAISKQQMLTAIVITAVLSLVSGVGLLYVAADTLSTFFIFLGIGIAAIVAAITYTAGPKPYGYAGLGDISVLLFFGLAGVIGTYYLHTLTYEKYVMLPAISCGLFSVAVLNLNNMRDIHSDELAGKISVPVRLGIYNAKIYHTVLILGGILSSLVFSFVTAKDYTAYYYTVLAGPMLRHIVAVWRTEENKQLDPFLKQMAILTLLFCIAFGISVYVDNV